MSVEFPPPESALSHRDVGPDSNGSGTDGPEAPTGGIWSARFFWATLGSCTLVFLSAFEALAVTTIMPLVSAELDGRSLYALAFAGPLAAGVIGMVISGNWSDRSGPFWPLIVSSALFAGGLVICGIAPTMGVLVVGRLVQGLGGGAVTVALYVIVARLYPPALHARIFAAFAAAWVVPSLIGPFAAGLVAEWFGWHWVFLGVVVLVLLATLMVVPVLLSVRGAKNQSHLVPWNLPRIGFSVLAAVAVLVLNLSAELDGAVQLVVAVVAIGAALAAVRPLLPRGSLRARRGLPSVVLVRGLIAAAFFGAEVYIPYLLTDQYAFTPALAGLALTGAALAWAGASWVQGRLEGRLSNAMAMVIGFGLVFASILLVLSTALWHLAPAVMIGAWTVSGAGMGLAYPRLSVLILSYSTPTDQGFNSSAMSISDSLGGALALATTGIVFSMLVSSGGAAPFVGCFALAAALAGVAFSLARRVDVVAQR